MWLMLGACGLRAPQYLMAQQQVEEQRRQLEQMEADQDRITDQVQAEMHRVKVSASTAKKTGE